MLAQCSATLQRRASKTALNQMTTCMVREMTRKKHKICALLLHPGTVDTDLSKPFQGVSTARADLMLTASPVASHLVYAECEAGEAVL